MILSVLTLVFLILKNIPFLWYNDKDYQIISIILNIYKKGYSDLDILDNYFSFIKITNMVDEKSMILLNLYANISKNFILFMKMK